MKSIFVPLVAAAAGLLAALYPAAAARAATPGRPDPMSIYAQIETWGGAAAKNGAGEDFCWRVNYYLGDFLTGYQAWKDPAWLDAAVKSYDYAISKMTVGPDGYKGWVGPYLDESAKWCADVHVGDAILIDHMLDFAELVLKDPALKKAYGDAANRYVELAKHDFVEKWVSRGTWHEDGPYGGFVQWDMFCPVGDMQHWQKVNRPDDTGVSLPFNKQDDAGQCLMKLYRITGEQAYRDQAQKIFALVKSRFQLVGDYYVWNYWEPIGPWDVDLQKNDTRMWMSTHPYRNYQAGEVQQIAEAYNTGVVFDQNDIQHIINTNLQVMWNGEKERPKFVNADAQLPQNKLTPQEQKARDAEVAANQYALEGRAGCLWTGLIQFDPTIRELCALGLKDPLARAYFQNVTLKSSPSFARLYPELPVTVFNRPFHSCKSITVAAVLPHTITRGQPSIVLCKARVNTDLEVAVYSADGKEKKLELFPNQQVAGGSDGHAGIHILQWDGSDPLNADKSIYPLAAGDYRIRWTTPDGYREFPVTIAN